MNTRIIIFVILVLCRLKTINKYTMCKCNFKMIAVMVGGNGNKPKKNENFWFIGTI